jgi:hypothetical protein
MARNALGRGLGALIRETDSQAADVARLPVAPIETSAGLIGSQPQLVDIDLIEPSPYQPRTRFREDALAECKILARHYESLGMKDKAARVTAFMARIDSGNAGPQKEFTGLKHPVKSAAPESANKRSEEAGIRKASIEEKGKEASFDLAAELEKFKSGGRRSQQPPGSGENLRKPAPIGGTRSMSPDFHYNPRLERVEGSVGLGFKKKGQREGAHAALAKVSPADGTSRDKILAAKFEMGLILKDKGKVEEALDLLEEVFTGRPGISQYQGSDRQADIKINEGGKTSAQCRYLSEFDRESQAEKSLGPGKNNRKNRMDRREYYCFYLLCSVFLWILQNQFFLNN